MAQDSFYVDPATLPEGVVNERGLPPGPQRRAAAHPHLADAGAGDGGRSRRRSSSSSPAPSTAATRSTPPTRRCSARSRASRSPRGSRSPTSPGRSSTPRRRCSDPSDETRLKPDFFPFTEPSVQVDVSCFACEGSGRSPAASATRSARAPAGSRSSAPGWSTRTCSASSSERLRPRDHPGLRLRHGDRADRDAQARDSRPAAVLRERRALPGAVRMKVPFCWLTEYCDPGLAPEEVAELLSMRAVEVERVSRIGVPSTEGFVVGKVVSAEQHPERRPAARLRGRDRRRARGRSSAARPTSPPARRSRSRCPGARLPDGSELGRAKLRGIESERDDPLRARARARRRPRRDHGPRRATRGRRGPRSTRCCRSPTSVLELDLNPNRVDCMGVYGVARELHAITGAPLADPPWERDAEPTGERRGRGARLGPRRGAPSSVRASPLGRSPRSRSGPRRRGSRRA